MIPLLAVDRWPPFKDPLVSPNPMLRTTGLIHSKFIPIV